MKFVRLDKLSPGSPTTLVQQRMPRLEHYTWFLLYKLTTFKIWFFNTLWSTYCSVVTKIQPSLLLNCCHSYLTANMLHVESLGRYALLLFGINFLIHFIGFVIISVVCFICVHMSIHCLHSHHLSNSFTSGFCKSHCRPLLPVRLASQTLWLFFRLFVLISFYFSVLCC